MTWSIGVDVEGGIRLIARGPWTAEMGAAYLEEGCDRISLMYPAGDLGFLRHLPDLRDVAVIGGQVDDLSPLEDCRGLTRLAVHSVVTTQKGLLDLRSLPHLRSVDVDQAFQPDHLPEMCLTDLRVMNWPGTDLQPVVDSPTLRHVQLDGIRRLRRFASPRAEVNEGLHWLNLAYSRGTIEDDGLDRLVGLHEVSLKGVRVTALSALGRLPRLTALTLEDCGDIPDVEWLRIHPTLEAVVLWGSTRVVSGDLQPLSTIPNARSVHVQHKRHYNRRFTSPAVPAPDIPGDGGQGVFWPYSLCAGAAG
jgi:hypothetical protein